MSVYLGQLGRLVALKCPASQGVEVEDNYTFKRTLEGRRYAYASPAGKRTWSLAVSDATTPRDIGAIQAFAGGEFGYGPFVFVSADAPVTNLLPPAEASCDPAGLTGTAVAAAGPLLTPDGWAGRSFTSGDPSGVMGFGPVGAPVIPGMPVTGSAYVVGAQSGVRLNFYNSSGDSVGTFNSVARGAANVVTRTAVTATAPALAAYARVTTFFATQAARPAITWTDTVFDWADGQGCPKAVIHGASRSLIMASADPRGGRYSSMSYTVTEVG